MSYSAENKHQNVVILTISLWNFLYNQTNYKYYINLVLPFKLQQYRDLHSLSSSFFSWTMNFDLLPQDCLAHILSLASTREACRLSIVSETMHSMANSDVVWEKFLPFDCEEVLSRLDSPLVCSTKKELYLKLCCPHLIDGGKKVHLRHIFSIYA